jgi:hypothetical protein
MLRTFAEKENMFEDVVNDIHYCKIFVISLVVLVKTSIFVRIKTIT